jgi:hypothetical protein
MSRSIMGSGFGIKPLIGRSNPFLEAGLRFPPLFAKGLPVFAGKGVIGGQALYRFSHARSR